MIYTLTPALTQGRFASHGQLSDLRESGVTHILNVCETPPLFEQEIGPFAEIAWHPLADDRRISDVEALATLDTLHRMICQTGSVVYVHCVAGWIRSPTIVWLYLLACGLEERGTAQEIVARNSEARPGHRDLIDADLLERVREHGRANYLPHPRPESLIFT